MKYKLIICLMFFAVLSVSSCSDDFEWVEMSIVETGCMNPWDHSNIDKTNKLEKIKTYLNIQDIWVKHITTQRYSDGPFCLSCACPTGLLIIIQIPEYDVEKAKEIGFYIIPDN